MHSAVVSIPTHEVPGKSTIIEGNFTDIISQSWLKAIELSEQFGESPWLNQKIYKLAKPIAQNVIENL